jgi:hypothetical protein
LAELRASGRGQWRKRQQPPKASIEIKPIPRLRRTRYMRPSMRDRAPNRTSADSNTHQLKRKSRTG